MLTTLSLPIATYAYASLCVFAILCTGALCISGSDLPVYRKTLGFPSLRRPIISLRGARFQEGTCFLMPHQQDCQHSIQGTNALDLRTAGYRSDGKQRCLQILGRMLFRTSIGARRFFFLGFGKSALPHSQPHFEILTIPSIRLALPGTCLLGTGKPEESYQAFRASCASYNSFCTGFAKMLTLSIPNTIFAVCVPYVRVCHKQVAGG